MLNQFMIGICERKLNIKKNPVPGILLALQ